MLIVGVVECGLLELRLSKGGFFLSETIWDVIIKSKW